MYVEYGCVHDIVLRYWSEEVAGVQAGIPLLALRKKRAEVKSVHAEKRVQVTIA